MLWRAVVREDPNKGGVFRESERFERASRAAATELAGDKWGKDSLSGNERNRLFLSEHGRQFRDATLLSGADHLGDGRSVVLFDYDRDGLPDLASVNINAPKLVLFHNELRSDNHFVALRFRGGPKTNRDGYGTRVVLKCGDRTLVEEHRCGEGYSAQNSRTMLLGLGDATQIDSLVVRWPSGAEERHTGLPADQLIHLAEGQAPVVEKYLAEGR